MRVYIILPDYICICKT